MPPPPVSALLLLALGGRAVLSSQGEDLERSGVSRFGVGPDLRRFSRAPRPCRCTKQYSPVCSTEGVTYSNNCFAWCNFARVQCRGRCPCHRPPPPSPPRQDLCTLEYEPVCGVDGRTHGNQCMAGGPRNVRCRKACPCQVTPKKCDLVCSLVAKAPVCGLDGSTHPSHCHAKCSGTTSKCVGQCPCSGGKDDQEKRCLCNLVERPVCGRDGRTHSNDCSAECVGVEVQCQGACPCRREEEEGNCICPAVFKPVCGADGKTHSNACSARCQGAKVRCEGPCPCSGVDPGCICSAVFDPVCGEDGRTYGNACQAGCANAEVKCARACPCPTFPASGEEGEARECEKHCPVKWAGGLVCGLDGRTYGSRCEARCNRVPVKCNRKCPCPGGKRQPQQNCVCPEIFSPVCGRDGVTYENTCYARCARALPARCSGKCPCRQCRCADIGGPVCGKDGVQYRSECQASCNNVPVGCKGKCPCRTVPRCERRCQQLPTRVVCAGKAETGPSGIFENPCFARCKIGPPVRFYPPWRCKKFKFTPEGGVAEGQQESLLAHLQL